MPLENMLPTQGIIQRIWQGVFESKTIRNTDKKLLEILNRVSGKIDEFSEIYINKLIHECNKTILLGLNHPRPVSDIYVAVNVYERIPSWLEIDFSNLKQPFEQNFFEQATITENLRIKKTAGMDLVNKGLNFTVLGQPGSGKTTFLKYIAIKTVEENSLGSKERKVPIYINLKTLSDSNCEILEFIANQYTIPDHDLEDRKIFFDVLLKSGKVIVLFDGLDEVLMSKLDLYLGKIEEFCIRSEYTGNQYILSCRTKAYLPKLGFMTVVEIADFDTSQIKSAVHRWFKSEPEMGNKCVEKLFASGKKNPRILDMAKKPLTLAMLCLAYNEEMGFSSNRYFLYKNTLDALLKQWDNLKRLERTEVYEGLELERKKQLLSIIAWETFKEGEFFIKQDVVEKHIVEYLIPFKKEKEFDPESILRAIEIQHGILIERAKWVYSFCHLSIQEYLVAKYIIDSENTKELYGILLSDNLLVPQWREVFYLLAVQLRSADDYLSQLVLNIDKISDSGLKTFFKEFEGIIGYPRNSDSPDFVGLIEEICIKFILLHFSSAKLFRGNPVLKNDFLDGVCSLSYDLVQVVAGLIDFQAQPASKRKQALYKLVKAVVYNIDPQLIYQEDTSKESLQKIINGTLTCLEKVDFERLFYYLYATQLLVDCLESKSVVIKNNRAFLWGAIFASNKLILNSTESSIKSASVFKEINKRLGR